MWARRKNKLRGRNQSVHVEPTMAAMRGELDAQNDPTQSKAHAKIDNEHLAESFAAEAERSVFDEPTYSVELGGEVPENAFTYEKFLAEQLDSTSTFESWFATGVIAAFSGVLAIAGAILGQLANTGLTGSVQFIAIAIFAPVIEEVMKTALLLWGVEQKPYLFKTPVQLMIIGGISGFVFAAVENVIYLTVYIEQPDLFIIVWRWTVCVALHTSTTLIASIGLVKIWQRVMRTGQYAKAEIGARYLFFAILIHGIYNGTVYLLGVVGVF